MSLIEPERWELGTRQMGTVRTGSLVRDFIFGIADWEVRLFHEGKRFHQRGKVPIERLDR